MVLREKSGEWAVITVVFIRLKKKKKKKASAYYVSESVLHGWGAEGGGRQRRVRPHYCAPVVPSLLSGKPHPDQVS